MKLTVALLDAWKGLDEANKLPPGTRLTVWLRSGLGVDGIVRAM